MPKFNDNWAILQCLAIYSLLTNDIFKISAKYYIFYYYKCLIIYIYIYKYILSFIMFGFGVIASLIHI